MGIFPEDTEQLDNIIQNSIENEELPLFLEYDIDFKTGNFLYDETGKNIIVEKNEALKIWIWKALQIPKMRFEIYSDDYGNEFETLIGKGYSKEFVDSEMFRLVEECLLINPYIKEILEVDTNFDESIVKVNIKAKTIYGEVDLSV